MQVHFGLKKSGLYKVTTMLSLEGKNTFVSRNVFFF